MSWIELAWNEREKIETTSLNAGGLFVKNDSKNLNFNVWLKGEEKQKKLNWAK